MTDHAPEPVSLNPQCNEQALQRDEQGTDERGLLLDLQRQVRIPADDVFLEMRISNLIWTVVNGSVER